MDFALTPEQRMIQDSARRMVARDIQPVLDAHDPDAPLPKDALLGIFNVLAGQGLTAPRVPESAGGSGMRMLDYGLMYEQIPPVVAMAMMAHEVTAARIYGESTVAQRERFLPGLIDGSRISGTGTTEPDAGSNPREIRTRVTETNDGLVVDGRKMWITNASVSDTVIVTCTEGADARGGRLRRIVVERDQSPYEARDIPTLGLQQGHLGEMVFHDCHVPKANALGTSGDAARLLTLTWNVNRPLIGLGAVHLAQRALDKAVEYAGLRRQFGKAIGGHQLVQKNLADIETAVVTSRLLCYHALGAIDRGERANGLSAMAKRYATTACQQAVSLAMLVHGAMGIGRETGLEQLFRDVRMLAVPDATDDILTLIQGRELTGLSAFGSKA